MLARCCASSPRPSTRRCRRGWTARSRSRPRWSTGSPREPTDADRAAVLGRHRRRRPQSRGHRAVQRVGDLRRLPGRPAGLGDRRRVADRRRHAVRGPQAVAAQRRRTRCWPTRARVRGHAHRRPRRSATRTAAPGSSSGGTTCAPHLTWAGRRRRARTAPRCSSASPTRGSGTRSRRSPRDGSQKLPVRILPVLRRERAAGRLPESRPPRAGRVGAAPAGVSGRRCRTCGRRSCGRCSTGRGRTRCPRVLAALDPALGDDAELVAAVSDWCRGAAASLTGGNADGWLSTGAGARSFRFCVVSRGPVIDTRGDDVARRWSLRLVAGLLAGGVVLSGCSEKQEANDSLPTAERYADRGRAATPRPRGPPDARRGPHPGRRRCRGLRPLLHRADQPHVRRDGRRAPPRIQRRLPGLRPHRDAH